MHLLWSKVNKMWLFLAIFCPFFVYHVLLHLHILFSYTLCWQKLFPLPTGLLFFKNQQLPQASLCILLFLHKHPHSYQPFVFTQLGGALSGKRTDTLICRCVPRSVDRSHLPVCLREIFSCFSIVQLRPSCCWVFFSVRLSLAGLLLALIYRLFIRLSRGLE